MWNGVDTLISKWNKLKIKESLFPTATAIASAFAIAIFFSQGGDGGAAGSSKAAAPQAGPLVPVPKPANDPSTTVQIHAQKVKPDVPKPEWHPPWKLMRVLSGHEGWVRTVAVDPSNEWFASSGNDRLIRLLIM